MTTENTICMPVETYEKLMKIQETTQEVVNSYNTEMKENRSLPFLLSFLVFHFLTLAGAVALGTYLVG